MPFHRLHMKIGFTLLEVIAVLALVSIFAVLAIVQHSASDATLVAQTQVLISHIRYARMRAMNTDTSWGIYYNFNSSNSYYLLYSGTSTVDIAQLPGESQDKVYIGGKGIDIASAIGAGSLAKRSFELRFDSWGRPQSIFEGTTHTGTLTLRLTRAGQTPQQFVITQNTGFIQ
jgi:prepilin-type N-terminal cleavage/methylation domain-containing protein